MSQRVRWEQKFSEWFDEVIEKAEIYDYGRYPVKGMGVWMPYGFKLRELVLNVIRKRLNETGHEEILLPLLIPEHLLRKESEHIRGFEDQVYWITHGGLEPLDVKLALRPTSETIISFMEALWIQSYKQLPKKYYQIASIFRYETKATRPMIRLREVTTFKEAHTVHDSFEDAERQVEEAIEVYKRIFDDLGIPYVISQRPIWDKFAGALYTIAFDTIFPDGRVLQIGTVHHLGQTFAKVFEVRVQKRDESIDYAWQTSYGISDRAVATVIAIHGDDRGLVLPPIVAPIQVIIIPIPGKTKEETEKIFKYAKEIEAKLKEKGVRVKVDEREEVTPGYKYYEWEYRGVPVRLEIGPREAANNTVTIARRDLLKKEIMKLDEFLNKVFNLFRDIEETLRKRAWEWFKNKITYVEDLDEAKKILESKKGIVEVPWCGSNKCGLEMQDYVDARALGSPLDKETIPKAKCPICGKEAKTLMRLARTY